MKIEIKVDERLENATIVHNNPILVESHWNDDEMVKITVRGTEVFVVASELQQALKRCTGWEYS